MTPTRAFRIIVALAAAVIALLMAGVSGELAGAGAWSSVVIPMLLLGVCITVIFMMTGIIPRRK